MFAANLPFEISMYEEGIYNTAVITVNEAFIFRSSVSLLTTPFFNIAHKSLHFGGLVVALHIRMNEIFWKYVSEIGSCFAWRW